MHRLLCINDIQEYDHYLNDMDRSKIKRLVQGADRLRAIGSIILQKDYIASVYPMDRKDIHIQYGEYGKPFYKELQYNVAHDQDYIIIVYSNGGPIGVDLMKRKHVNIYNYGNCFTAREKYNLTTENFIVYWCVKEALVKAIGIGLRIDLDKVEYDAANCVIYYEQESYKVSFINVSNDYICAVIVLPDNSRYCVA